MLLLLARMKRSVILHIGRGLNALRAEPGSLVHGALRTWSGDWCNFSVKINQMRRPLEAASVERARLAGPGRRPAGGRRPSARCADRDVRGTADHLRDL